MATTTNEELGCAEQRGNVWTCRDRLAHRPAAGVVFRLVKSAKYEMVHILGSST